MVDYEKARARPSVHFDSPFDIVKEENLTLEQRVKLLRQWEYDLVQLQVATEENMPAPSREKSGLREVRAALRQLDARPDNHPGASKYG